MEFETALAVRIRAARREYVAGNRFRAERRETGYRADTTSADWLGVPETKPNSPKPSAHRQNQTDSHRQPPTRAAYRSTP